ncbi:Cysteine-rich receptor-like protein kinase 7 [Hordeum vulgare]|nr:Cysteine-rich receptor-like protein kinase 7 [Hordeum vulgare]
MAPRAGVVHGVQIVCRDVAAVAADPGISVWFVQAWLRLAEARDEMPRPAMVTLYGVVSFLKVSLRRSSRPLSATSRRNPRSIDQKTTTRLCHLALGASFLEVYAGSRDQWMFSLVERCFILHIQGDESRWRGALVIWHLICDDGLAQKGDTVWRRGDVDGSLPGKGDALVQF